MNEEYVYIASRAGKRYSLRYRDNVKDFIDDIKQLERQKYKIVKSFIIPHDLFSPVVDACYQFIDGKLTSKDLEARVKELRK